jgi:hypothetical protein
MTPELQDLGHRIEACMRKHGYTPEMIERRVRPIRVSLTVNFANMTTAFQAASLSVREFARRLEEIDHA